MNTENTTAEYWGEAYPDLIDALSGLTRSSTTTVTEELAGIAGDHADMPDDEVLAAFINEAPARQRATKVDQTRDEDLPVLDALEDDRAETTVNIALRTGLPLADTYHSLRRLGGSGLAELIEGVGWRLV